VYGPQLLLTYIASFQPAVYSLCRIVACAGCVLQRDIPERERKLLLRPQECETGMEQSIQRVATQKIGNFSKATDHHRDSIYEDAFWRNMEAFCLSGKLCMCISSGLDKFHLA